MLLAELMALTRVLELSEGQRANIFTDSKYAYLTLHAHAAIWKEKQFKILDSIFFPLSAYNYISFYISSSSVQLLSHV